MAQLSTGRLVTDLIIVLVVAIPLLILETAVEPYKRGFYCDDESIRYPYKDDTVSSLLCFLGMAAIGVIIIVVFEGVRLGVETKHAGAQLPTYRLGKYNVHRLIVRLYVFIGFFIFGGCLNQFITMIGKFTIGRLRPHFLDICKPDWKLLGTACCASCHTYVNKYQCNGTETSLIHKAHLSFPSGHASFSFYVAVYLCLYLQARVFWTLYSQIALPFIQFALISLATFIALSRISDYKHHWSDVLTGTVLGISVAIITGLCFSRLFQRREMFTESLPHSQTPSIVQEQNTAVGVHLVDQSTNTDGENGVFIGNLFNRRELPPVETAQEMEILTAKETDDREREQAVQI